MRATGACGGGSLHTIHVANWKQIQGQIRRARTGPDAASKLMALYERTRDAMVAYELGVAQEKAGQHAEAIGWYSIAYERFRRADWRSRAGEALTRLGAPLPEGGAETATPGAPPGGGGEDISAGAGPMENLDQPQEAQGSLELAEDSAAPAPQAESQGIGAATAGKRRRRGRRGGRGRRRGAGAGEPGVAASSPLTSHERAAPAGDRHGEVRVMRPPRVEADELPPQMTSEPAERVSEAPQAPAEAARPRAGDPGFSSRTAQLDAQLRRLFSAPQYRLDETEHAPAGPGVLMLSESDQSTHYYLEACRTLRIALGQIGKSERGRSGGSPVRERMAEHLGISETKVSKYLKDHCTVRWLQLDEGASHLAHFAIAVLKPVLNDGD